MSISFPPPESPSSNRAMLPNTALNMSGALSNIGKVVKCALGNILIFIFRLVSNWSKGIDNKRPLDQAMLDRIKEIKIIKPLSLQAVQTYIKGYFPKQKEEHDHPSIKNPASTLSGFFSLLEEIVNSKI